MKPPTPPRVPNIEDYWTGPPPLPSTRCTYWVNRISKRIWLPNRRLRQQGYTGASDYLGVYIWEYLHVLRPLIDWVAAYPLLPSTHLSNPVPEAYRARQDPSAGTL